MRDDVAHVGEVCECKWSYVLDVILTLSGSVELWLLLCLITAWTCVVVIAILVVCSLSVPPIYVSVCFMLDCVGELFVECARYLCG